MRLNNIRIEYGKTERERVCIIQSNRPVISWALLVPTGEYQSAYRVKISLFDQVYWDTGWISKDDLSVRYDGEEFITGEVYTLQLQLKNNQDEIKISEQRKFCQGQINDWDAKWIGEKQQKKDAVVKFYYDFTCKDIVQSACLFVCGLGYNKVYLNGQDVFTDPLNPAYSEYEKQTYYMAIPELEYTLHSGKNHIIVRVAQGWRTPTNVCYKLTNRIPEYTGKLQMSAMLRIRYRNGGIEWIKTDSDWNYCYDAIISSNIFLGECNSPTYRDAFASNNAIPVAIIPKPGMNMTVQTIEPVRYQEKYSPCTISEIEPEIWLVDFGQNIAGVCELRIPNGLKKDDRIEIRHMESLNEDGRLDLRQLRNADSIDTYIASGDEHELKYWKPEFTYHGFRYVEVTGYKEGLAKTDITAISLYSDIKTDSFFKCGSALVSQIAKNALQTEKANIQSILTDCPQRDERMGWMNDATVRFESVPYCFDIGRLFPKIVHDCMDVQGEDGSITCTAPFAFGMRPADPVCSSYLIAGWEAWIHTGNLEIIREGFEGFKAWNQFLESKTKDWIVTYSYYGDWAAPAYACQSDEFAVSAVTPGEYMSTGYFYYNTKLLIKMAELIGKKDEAKKLKVKLYKIQEAFLNKWWNPDTGQVCTGSQGCQSFALWLNILPESGTQIAADYLHRNLLKCKYQFTTGNLCTRYMFEVLSIYGYIEDAWKIITKEDYPSIGYMIQNEATTIWERFELKNNPTMNSHNHPMYGAVNYWFYAYLAGLKPVENGWKKFTVKPYIPSHLLSVNASVKTPYGDVVIHWMRRYEVLHLFLTVPYGTQAEIYLPWGLKENVSAGMFHWRHKE